jgi:NaMN:DMB phosphoribosyltransferase
VVREGVGAGGKMTQALYAHMNNKRKKKKTKQKKERFIHKVIFSKTSI